MSQKSKKSIGARRILAALAVSSLGLLTSQTQGAFLTNPNITNSAAPFAGLPAANVFNGDQAQYASNTLGAATFIDFDFGAPTTIDAFDLVNRPGTSDAVTSYNLVFSADSTFGAGDTTLSFTQDYTGVGGNYLGVLNQFAPQTARFVRWQVTGVSGGANNNGATEMRFRSAGGATRLAPAAVTVFDSATPFSATYDKSNASDGLLGNGVSGDYSSANLGNATFLDFDLGSTQPITGFELMQRMFSPGDRAPSFNVLFSNDSNFATTVDTKSYTSSAMSFSDTFAAVNARYVRYDVTGAATTGNFGAQEMSFLVVPEPGSAALIGLAVAGMAMGRRRRRLPGT